MPYNRFMASPILHVRVPSPHLLTTIRSLAARDSKTVSDVVRELIIEGLEARARQSGPEPPST